MFFWFYLFLFIHPEFPFSFPSTCFLLLQVTNSAFCGSPASMGPKSQGGKEGRTGLQLSSFSGKYLILPLISSVWFGWHTFFFPSWCSIFLSSLKRQLPILSHQILPRSESACQMCLPSMLPWAAFPMQTEGPGREFIIK